MWRIQSEGGGKATAAALSSFYGRLQWQRCQQRWQNRMQCAVAGVQVFNVQALGQDFARGFGYCKSVSVLYVSNFVFSFPSISACCSMSSQKVLFSLSQPDLHFYCLRLKTWASPDPSASVSSLLKPQSGTFMISQVPSRSSNFISCNHKISDTLTKNLRM